MAKASIVAAELRRLADALETQPNAEIIRPYVYFSGDEKDSFLNTARALPRPLHKRVDDFGDEKYRKIRVEYDNPGISVSVAIPRVLTCEVVEPAKPAVYRCEPILSEDEEIEVQS